MSKLQSFKTLLSGFVFGIALAFSGLLNILNRHSPIPGPSAAVAAATYGSHLEDFGANSQRNQQLQPLLLSQERIDGVSHLIFEIFHSLGSVYKKFVPGLRIDAVDNDMIESGGSDFYISNSNDDVVIYITLLCLTALIVSTVVIYLANDIFRFVRLTPRKASNYRWFSHDGNVVGGLIQGIGMGILRSEPGLMLLGAGIGGSTLVFSLLLLLLLSSSSSSLVSSSSNWWANLGGILGGFAFVLGNDRLKRKVSTPRGKDGGGDVDVVGQIKKTKTIDTLQDKLGIRTGSFVAGLTAFAIPCIGFFLVRKDQRDQNMVGTGTFRAVIGGVGIGLSQLISIVLTGGTLGVSSVYPVIATQFLRLLGMIMPDPGYNSLYFSAGIISSGTLYAFTADSRDLQPFISDLEPTKAVLGGFCVIFGARLAGGCTSGHGLSGCGLLSISSFITILSMIFGILASTVVAPKLALLLL